MIRCWVKCGDGRELELPDAISWKFSYGTDTPCDSFFLKCLWEHGQEKLLSAACRFYAQWEEERVFTGVVDDFSVQCGPDGLFLELSGRGMAALLLDNEALPAQYQRCTWADIQARHVSPYGIQTIGGQNLPAVSGFTVGSGSSEWSVVREYARYYGGVTPRFDRWGRLVLEPWESHGALLLDGSVPVERWEYREERHGVLSQVAVRHRTAPGVQWVSNEAFLAEGGRARRVVTVPNTMGTAAMRYSADYQLQASRSERVRLVLTLAGGFLAWPGQLVDVNLAKSGVNGTYRVARAEVVCGPDGLTTTLELGLASI